MQVDVASSMIIYTIATIAFYLLGAGVLHGMGLMPAKENMIRDLANMYTQTLGPWALWVFYIGAVATLYGTIFAGAFVLLVAVCFWIYHPIYVGDSIPYTEWFRRMLLGNRWV